LREVAGEIGRIDLPQSRGIDQIGVPRDDFAKRGFLPAFDVGVKELGVRLVLHLIY